jgi:hypothetical protein
MVLQNGQILPQKPALYSPPQQKIEGSPLEAAAKQTIESHDQHVATLNAMVQVKKVLDVDVKVEQMFQCLNFLKQIQFKEYHMNQSILTL